MELNDIKSLVDKTGEAFEAFKKTNDENLKKRDALLEEKMTRIEGDLDKAIEAKAAIERALAAEKKEREDLELRLQRNGTSKSDDKFEAELKSFNVAMAAERGKSHTDFTADEYRGYKSAFGQFLRKDNRLLSAEEVKTLSVGSDP